MNDYLPFNALLSDPLRAFRIAALLALLGVLLGAIVPGALALRFGTFSSRDVIDKIPYETARTQMREYEIAGEQLKTAILNIDRLISERLTHNPEDASGLLKVREETIGYSNKRQPPFHVVGFYPVFTWPVLYVIFFWLLFLISPRVYYGRRPLSYLAMLAGLEIFFRWPTWIRNSGFLRNVERAVYADANIDVSVPAFILQEALALVVAVCILEFVLIWSSYFVKWRQEILAIRGANKLDANLTYGFIQATSRQFVHWQICSILLAVAFAPWTFFFWQFVIDFGDRRYAPHALIVHALWGTCWLVASLPLVQTWYEWTLMRAMSSMVKNGDEGDGNRRGKFAEPPIGSLNIIASVVLALGTFGSPVIKAIFTAH